MEDWMQPLKKAVLFILGGLFFAAAGQAGAQKAKDKNTKDKDKKTAGANKKKDAKKTGKKNQKKTTLEKKWPENSSGSE